jgi:P27 family predicted phage terminase small subunit
MKPLSEKAAAFKAAILEQFTFEDEASLAILDTGLESFDLFHQAQEQVDREGLTVMGDRGQIKAHPLLSVIRDQRAAFLSALKMLRLDVSAEEKKPVGSPTAFELYQKRK